MTSITVGVPKALIVLHPATFGEREWKMRWWVTVGATVWCLCRLRVGVVLVVGGAAGLG